MDDETSFSLVRSFIVLRDAFRQMRREQVAFLRIEQSRHESYQIIKMAFEATNVLNKHFVFKFVEFV